MTSTGVRRRRTIDEKIGDTIDNTNDEYIQRSKKGIADSSPITGDAGKPATSGTTIPGASTLDPAGGTMFGSLAYNPLLLAISDGRVDMQANQSGASKASSYMLVTGQGTPDDLHFIDGADKNGQLLNLQGTEGQIIILKHASIASISNIVGTGTVNVTTTIAHGLTTGEKVNILDTTNFNIQNVSITVTGTTTFTYSATGNATAETSGLFQNGNILTPDGTDITLDGTSTTPANVVPWVPLLFDPTVEGGGAWRVQFGAGGTGGVSFPITPTVNILGTVTTTQNINLSLATAHSTSMTLGASISITFSGFPATGTQIEWELEITQDATGGRVITWPAAVVNPPTLSTTPGLVAVVVFRTNDGGTTIRVGNTVTTGSSVSQWANFPAVSDIDYATFDGINIDRSLFDQAAGSAIGATATGITSTVLGDLSLNVPTGGSYFGSINGVNVLTLQIPTADPIFQIRGASTNVPIIRTFQEKGSAPTLGTLVGKYEFFGTDSTGSTQKEFASVTADYEDVTIGSVDGSIHLNATIGGTPTAFISGNNNNDGKVSIWKNLFMQTGIEIELNSNRLYPRTTATDTFIEAISDTIGVFVTDAASAKATFGTTRLILKNDYFIQPQAVELRNVTADLSSPLDGTQWYNSTLNKFRARENGVTVDLISAAGNSISQLDSSVTVTDTGSNGLIQFKADNVLVAQMQNNRWDFQTTPVFGITAITFDASQSMTASATGIILNFPDVTDVFDLKFNSLKAFSVDQTRTQIYSTIPNTTKSLLSIFRDDPSPAANDVIGEIEFRGRDTAAANIVYGKIGMELEIATAATSQGSFQWTLRNNGADQDQMSLKDGVLGVSRHLPTAAASGAALVLERIDSGAAIGDEAGEISFNINDGTVKNFAVINAVWDNTTTGDDSARMDFKLQTNDVLSNIMTLRGSALTTGLVAIEVSGESYIKAKTGVMGFFVTSDPDITNSGIIGNSGTIQIPQFSDGSPTLAQLNAAFGSFDGAIGQDTSDGKLYVRKSSTVWSFYNESGTVT